MTNTRITSHSRSHHDCGCGGKQQPTAVELTAAQLAASIDSALDSEENGGDFDAFTGLVSLLATHPGLRITLSMEASQ